jgi:hypothetical protein
MNSQVQ